MFFIYLDGKKEYRHNLKNAYRSQVPNDEFFYFVMIPCLNEGKVIKDTIQHLMELGGRKQIIIIDDDSIDDTLIQANSIKGPITIHERKLPKARTGKGDSLNSALPVVTNYIRKHHLDPQKCIVGVLDADGILSANSIYKLNDAFNDPSVDAVQLRVKMKSPNKILQTFQDIEFYVINNLIQLIRTNLNAVALCGNGQFFRVSSVLKQLGDQPWGNALLEDYELTLRMELHGLHIKYLNDAYVDQEALISVKRLIKQRARWAQGGWNCWKYLPDIIRSKIMTPSQKFDAYFFFFQPIINLLGDFSIIYLTAQFIIRYAAEPEF
jgi:Glycosyltransferases, probably involved in cell wall biogenesis